MKCRLFRIVVAVLWFSPVASALAQGGYLGVGLYAGDNLVACPLVTSPDSLIGTIFWGLPNDSTFTEWDPKPQAFLPLSVYDTQAGWSINYELPLGAGGVLHSPSNVTFAISGTMDTTWTAPQPTPGLNLLSCGIPLAHATFRDIVGRDPQEGEWVRTLDAPTQTYRTTTFRGAGGWDSGTPAVGPGQAAYFYLSVRLSVELAPPNNLILSWPTNMGPWQLQERILPSGGAWADVIASPQEVNGRQRVILPLPPDDRCYRLRTP